MGVQQTLKAKAANGSLESALRVRTVSSLFTSLPSTSGTSNGDGKYSTTPSNTTWTPLFLNAEPQKTGYACDETVNARTLLDLFVCQFTIFQVNFH